MSDEVTGIVTVAVAAIGVAGSLIARWTQTNPERPWYVRLARVLDATQVLDSTRKLDDE